MRSIVKRAHMRVRRNGDDNIVDGIRGGSMMGREEAGKGRACREGRKEK
jgi:hypothetical protein